MHSLIISWNEIISGNEMLLDIDFDYFVKETRFHDFSYRESEFFMESMWDIRFITAYGNPFTGPIDLTKELILDDDALKYVLDFIRKCDGIESWAISDSHLFAYEYIKDDVLISTLDGIVHIDRHNDYNILEDRIHAGNWLRYIKKNLPGIPIYWIPQSKKDYLYADEKIVKRELEKLFGPPIIYDPAPKNRTWNYEKLMECGIKDRDTINAIMI